MPTISPTEAQTALLKAISAAQNIQQKLKVESQRIQFQKESARIGVTVPSLPTKPLS